MGDGLISRSRLPCASANENGWERWKPRAVVAAGFHGFHYFRAGGWQSRIIRVADPVNGIKKDEHLPIGSDRDRGRNETAPNPVDVFSRKCMAYGLSVAGMERQ
jgi:hypothetical protein